MDKKKLNGDFRRKIKTREELLDLIGKRPRKGTVIMCHGTFDIVHPGHVRHLLYASEKADILIASLTCDAHITKANFRPFVPEQLRAMNLAALEVVDYVVIDQNPTPIENICFLQPDYFAKGYEYTGEGVHPRTREEIEALETYGGEILFTPGDIVYSSSRIIENDPPRIAAEKLRVFMESEGITFKQLHDTLAGFREKRVHVVGDSIVDTYVYTSMIGAGAKTPTLSVKQGEVVDFVGGAAIVSKHLAAAGASVRLTTLLGEDALKNLVLKDLSEAGVQCGPVVDKTRPTTRKTLYVCAGHRLLKVDQVDNRAISRKILDQFVKSLSDDKSCDAVVFSDFRHGVFSKSTLDRLVGAIPKGALKVADSQVSSRWGNILDFEGFDLITPNEREARFSLGDQDLVVRPLALEIYNRARCKYLILKLGEKGIITYRPGDSYDPRKFFTLDSFAERVVDPIGSGDALLAYATLGLLVSGSEGIASILGSFAAAIACEQDGNRVVTMDAVKGLLDQIEKRISYP